MVKVMDRVRVIFDSGQQYSAIFRIAHHTHVFPRVNAKVTV